MKSRIISVLKVLFFLGIGLLMVWWFAKGLSEDDIEKIWTSIKGAEYYWLLISLVLAIFSHLSRALRWKMLMAPMGYNPSTKNTFFAVMIGYLANLAFPRLGEVTRCGILNRYENIPLHKSVGTVIAERAVDLITLALVFLLTIATQFDVLYGYAHERIIQPFSKKLLGALPQGSGIVIILAVVIAFVLTYRYLRKRFQENIFFQKIMGLWWGFIEGLRAIAKVKNPLLFVGHSIFIWIMYFGMLYVCFFCMDATSGLGFDPAISTLAIGSIAMIVVQGGIGAYPVFVTETLSLYGVDVTVGFAFGWLVWAAQTILVVATGFLSLLLLPILNRRPHDAPRSSTEAYSE